MFGNQFVMWLVIPGQSACDHECGCRDSVVDAALEKSRAQTEMHFPVGVCMGTPVSV